MCLSRWAISSFCQVARTRRALSPVPIAGATERCPSGMASELGVAVASAATDSVEACVCTAAIFGSSSFGFFELVLRHHPVGLFGLGRLVLRQLGFLDLGLLLGKLWRCRGGIGIRTGRQVGHFTPHRGQFESDFDRGCAERIVGLFGLQMRDRQRRAADVKRKRDHRGKNPEPPGWLLLVEIRSGFAGAACAAAGSGAPSSATSLIFE